MTNSQFSILHSQLILLLLALFLCLLLSSCDNSTAPKSGSLSGSVILENDSGDPALNPVDYSEVTVALYALTVLDTTIVRINQEHPSIGVQINQETEFDHRLQAPISVTVTNSNGTFSLKGIPFGEYNVVIFKSGWSIKYLHNIALYKTKSMLTNVVELNPARMLSGFVHEPFVFESDNTYIVSENASFIGPVTIKTGANIYVSSGGTIDFYNDVNILSGSASEYWKIDTSFNLYSATPSSIEVGDYFSYLSFRGGYASLTNALIRHIGEGVAFNHIEGSVSNVDVKNFKAGVSFNSVKGRVEKSNFRRGSQIAIHELSMSDSLTVSKCLIYKAKDGIVAKAGASFSIDNTYFFGNENALRPQDCRGIINNNNFDKNWYDIWQSTASTIIQKNNFYHSSYTCVQASISALVRDNNFFSSARYFIMIRGNSDSPTFVHADLDAKYNYWAVADIEPYVLDAGDNADWPGAECPYYVIYLPKRSSKVMDAGIRS